MAKIESSEVARNLFIRLETAINRALKGKGIRGERFQDLHHVGISTDEQCQEERPEKGIFYIKLFWLDEEKPPTIVGIGFLTDRNEIWLDYDAVPDGFRTLFREYFGFGVIAVRRNFEQMKADLDAMIARSSVRQQH